MASSRSSYELDPFTPRELLLHEDHDTCLDESAQGSIIDPASEDATDTQRKTNTVAEPQFHQSKTLHAKGWLWEVLSLLTACVSLAGFMSLLMRYDGKPSPHWKFGMSLNTAVSLMSTMFRINILVPIAAGISQMGWIWLARPGGRLDDVVRFDDASRGPWGCLVLLRRTRFVHIASLGAWLSLACLALGPFFQQTIRYDEEFAPDTTRNATTSVAYSYSGARDSTKGGLPDGRPRDVVLSPVFDLSMGSRNLITVGRRNAAPDEDDNEFSTKYYRMPHNLRSAMFNAMFTSNLMSLPDPLYNCPTGNCTWGPFLTLGVSASCFDISSEVSLKREMSIQNSSDGYKIVSSGTGFLVDFLNDTNPQTFMKLRSITPADNASYMAPFARVSGILAAVEWVKVLRGFSNAIDGVGAHINESTVFEAHRCIFHFAVHELEEKVINGTYQVNERIRYTEAANDTLPSLVYNPNPPDDVINSGKNFTISQESFGIISSQFTKDPNFLQGKVEVSETSSLSGPPTAFTLFQADNVTRAMYNLADYMTKAFRANDSLLLQAKSKNPLIIARNQTIDGIARSPQQFVHVQWAWLALPIIVLLLATVFLCTVILTSAAYGVGNWKDSPLTLFFHCTPGERDFSDRKKSLHTAGAMQKAASEMQAMIRKRDRATIEVD
ncbi:hypothetical protein FKW77_003088 [Venturia effusa]|uniref:Uncharacterized protein n=1 Tax=Venturia effusa TaxID=50376 RepID=A0A517LNL0_9PEZI|nr:hypothetical protein FKW77_003088 [Venturia effusa]